MKEANKHTTLETLKQIKKDHCIAKSGKEYCEHSVTEMIRIKETKKFDEYEKKLLAKFDAMCYNE